MDTPVLEGEAGSGSRSWAQCWRRAAQGSTDAKTALALSCARLALEEAQRGGGDLAEAVGYAYLALAREVDRQAAAGRKPSLPVFQLAARRAIAAQLAAGDRDGRPGFLELYRRLFLKLRGVPTLEQMLAELERACRTPGKTEQALDPVLLALSRMNARRDPRDVRDLVDTIGARERKVLELLSEWTPGRRRAATLGQVGSRLGLSRERVRQLAARARRRLRRARQLWG